jgi:hypothetical protein
MTVRPAANLVQVRVGDNKDNKCLILQRTIEIGRSYPSQTYCCFRSAQSLILTFWLSSLHS